MEKGLDVFIDTIERLRARGVKHRVLAIGMGPAGDWFRERLGEEAIFVGQQTGADLARAVASCDVLLNPSVTEAFGNVTLEAMACGLPVVAIAATGTNNLVDDGVSGFLRPPGDVAGLAVALERYADFPGMRAAHGEAGLNRAKTRDWDRINSAVLDVYRLVQRRRNRA